MFICMYASIKRFYISIKKVLYFVCISHYVFYLVDWTGWTQNV